MNQSPRPLLLFALLLILGCSEPATPRPTRTAAVGPSPTVASIFTEQAVPTPPRPTIPPIPTTDPAALRPAAERLIELPIFDEALSQGWSLDPSEKMRSQITAAVAQQGQEALEVTPSGDFGKLIFAVEQGAEAIDRERIAGLSLWISPKDAEIAPSDLAITIIGSNDYRYWRDDDDSVMLDNQSFFSETRLYYLGVNRAIPPGTWVELVVWTDQLPFDPDYRYVTAVYIKNDKGFRETFFVDHVSLLLLPKE